MQNTRDTVPLTSQVLDYISTDQPIFVFNLIPFNLKKRQTIPIAFIPIFCKNGEDFLQ